MEAGVAENSDQRERGIDLHVTRAPVLETGWEMVMARGN
jgi:hypothetical protein